MSFFTIAYLIVASICLIWFGSHSQELIYGVLALWFMGAAIFAKVK